MFKYLARIAAAGLYDLDNILKAASDDKNITDKQYYYIYAKAEERGAQLLFNH